MVWGALVGAGLTFLGNRSANKQNAERHKIDDARYAKADYDQSFEGIRANAEAAGFNPAAVVGVGSGTGAGGSSSGAAFSSNTTGVGSIVASAFQQDAQVKIQKAQLELENRRLNEIVEDSILRPQIAGIYGNRGGTANASNRENSDSPAPNSGIGDTSYLGGERELKVNEYTSGAGLTEISNAFGTFATLGDDGEPWGIDEVATAGGSLIFDLGRRASGMFYRGSPARVPAPSIDAPMLSPPSSYRGEIPDNPWRYRN